MTDLIEKEIILKFFEESLDDIQKKGFNKETFMFNYVELMKKEIERW